MPEMRALAIPPKEVSGWASAEARASSRPHPAGVLLKVAKIGAKVVAHGRYVVFQMAEMAVPRGLFRRILNRIEVLRPSQVPRCDTRRHP